MKTIYAAFLALTAAQENIDFSPYGFVDSRSYEKRRAFFLETYGNDRYVPEVEDLSEKELTRFSNQIYLDYTGSAVYTESQLEECFQDLKNHAYGNAHSRNPSADLTDKEMEYARDLIADFFEAYREEYAVVFTSGATASLKLVGEGFPFTVGSQFMYLRSNHNSVLGMREYAIEKRADFMAIDEWQVDEILRQRKAMSRSNDQWAEKKCLFAYPLKDNFAGTYFPVGWVADIRRYGLSDDCRWYVMVDAAAYAATNRMKAAEIGADFYALSFYKLFGYPTGSGLLLMRTDLADELQKIYWGGGTVVAADCDSRWCKLKENPSMRFEDGTASFLSIVCLKYGFQALERISMEKIGPHVASLSAYVAAGLRTLTHLTTSESIVELYTRGFPEGELPVGGVLAFNLKRPDGTYINFAEVEDRAAGQCIHIRTGCFCNPGACASFLGLTSQDMRLASETRESCGDPVNPLEKNIAIGAVRASFGYLSTFHQADLFLEFIRSFAN